MSEPNDEDLELAIAMSLQQSPAQSPAHPEAQSEIIDLSNSDDGDGDLRKAMALSLQDDSHAMARHGSALQRSPPPQVAPPKDKEKEPASRAESKAEKTSHIALDRKVMEQERLARLGKRKRDPSLETSSKQTTWIGTAQLSRLAKDENTFSHGVDLQYPKGAIKRTFARGYPRTTDITIEEVLQASTVNIAVISAFMWDSEWLFEKLNPNKVRQVWIMNAKDKDVQKRWVQEMENMRVPNLKIHYPPMDGMILSMHSKFMLLFGEDKLRVVIMTANMIQTDWGEVANDWQPGVMENSAFLIDLPRRKDKQIGKLEDLTAFGQEMVYFLEQQKVGRNVVDGLLKFDFTETGRLAFVHSIGGSHKTEADHATGLPSLSKAIQDLGLMDVRCIQLDYAASSLGAVNDSLLQRLHLAACGKSFTTESEVSNVRDDIRIYYPTKETVEKSIGGPDCAGIVSLSRQHYNAPTFPKECLRDYDSTRRGMLSHNKLLFARGRKADGQAFAWVYVGSANMSESAWGGQKVVKNGKMGRLSIRNWECGIVVPVPGEKVRELQVGGEEMPRMDVFEGTVEVPFQFPGEGYHGRQPWFLRSR